jgi:hypothetical protein
LVKLYKLACKFNADYLDFFTGMGVQRGTSAIETFYPKVVPRGREFTIRLHGLDFSFRERFEVVPLSHKDPYSCLTARYRYFSSAMTSPFGRAKFAAQKFGILVNPAIVWELIPLSFVIDWVYPVGKVLEKLRIDAVDLNIVVDEAGFGNRLSLHRQVDVLPQGQTLWRPLYSDQCTLYQRTRVPIEDSPNELKFGKFTMNKVLSGSSLLWTIVLRKRIK